MIANDLDDAGIFFDRIATVHRFEDPVASRLNRQVDGRADHGVRCDRVNDILSKVGRIRGHKTKTFQAFDLRNITKKFGKTVSMQIFAVSIDVLSKQGNFLDAALNQLRDLFNDLFGTT